MIVLAVYVRKEQFSSEHQLFSLQLGSVQSSTAALEVRWIFPVQPLTEHAPALSGSTTEIALRR